MSTAPQIDQMRYARYEATDVKMVGDAEDTFDVVATHRSVDRDGDIIEPSGGDLSHFRKNPVLLWAHDHHSPPIGKVLKIEKTGDRIKARITFDMEDHFARLIAHKMAQEFINAVSIGFLPREGAVERREEGGFLIREWELLELSVVPVQSNHEALVSRGTEFGDAAFKWAKRVISEHKAGQVLNAANRGRARQIIEIAAEMLASQGEDPQEVLADMSGTSDDSKSAPAHKEVTDFQDHPLAGRDHEWTGDDAVDSWREYTDSDEEPSEQYRQGFMWFDADDAEDFGAYKLPYVDVIDGTPQAVPRAIFAIAATLEGARGGVDIPDGDVSGVQSHVEQYYEKMRNAFEDDSLIAPWNQEDAMSDSQTETKMSISEDVRQEINGVLDAMKTRADMIQSALGEEEPDPKEIYAMANRQLTSAETLCDILHGSYGEPDEMRAEDKTDTKDTETPVAEDAPDHSDPDRGVEPDTPFVVVS